MPDNRRHQRMVVDRFGEAFNHARAKTAPRLLVQHMSRQADHRQAGGNPTDAARGLVAIHLGHLHIHQHDVEGFWRGGDPVDGLPAVFGKFDAGARFGEDIVENETICFHIFDHQHANARQHRTGPNGA